MRAIAIGDLIRDNLGRKGLVIERARTPGAKWLAAQEDPRMQSAAGSWWHVAPLDGGGVLVPEALAKRLHRATVDDVAKVVESDATENGKAILLHLFTALQSNMSSPRKQLSSPTIRSSRTRPKRRAV